MEVFTLVLLKKMKFPVMASTLGQMEKCMKVPGPKTRCTVTVNSSGKMAKSTKVNSRTIKEKAREYSIGKMVVSMTVCGSTENSTDKAFL